MKQPRFNRDYYKKIGHDALLKRSAAELAKADAKYKRYLEIAIKREIARRKKLGLCEVEKGVFLLEGGDVHITAP